MATTEPSLRSLADAISAVGVNEFHSAILTYVSNMLPGNVYWIMRYSPYLVPQVMHYKSDISKSSAIDFGTITRMYAEGLYRVDPWFHYWRNVGRAGVVTLKDIISGGLTGERFYSAFASLMKLRDDIGIFFPTMGRCSIAISIQSSSRFSARHVSFLRDVYWVLAALQQQHDRMLLMRLVSNSQTNIQNRAYLIVDDDWRPIFSSQAWQTAVDADPGVYRGLDALRKNSRIQALQTDKGVLQMETLPSEFTLGSASRIIFLESGTDAESAIDFNSALDRFRTSKLTPREHQVVRMTLLGLSVPETAERLKLSIGTVRNYKKRTYGKLGIKSERELFSQFIKFSRETSQ